MTAIDETATVDQMAVKMVPVEQKPIVNQIAAVDELAAANKVAAVVAVDSLDSYR
jgi:hypothetical protein